MDQEEKCPYAYSYSGEIDCTFYTDKYNTQRMFFENWQSKIADVGLVQSGFEEVVTHTI